MQRRGQFEQQGQPLVQRLREHGIDVSRAEQGAAPSVAKINEKFKIEMKNANEK